MPAHTGLHACRRADAWSTLTHAPRVAHAAPPDSPGGVCMHAGMLRTRAALLPVCVGAGETEAGRFWVGGAWHSDTLASFSPVLWRGAEAGGERGTRARGGLLRPCLISLVLAWKGGFMGAHVFIWWWVGGQGWHVARGCSPTTPKTAVGVLGGALASCSCARTPPLPSAPLCECTHTLTCSHPGACTRSDPSCAHTHGIGGVGTAAGARGGTAPPRGPHETPQHTLPPACTLKHSMILRQPPVRAPFGWHPHAPGCAPARLHTCR